MGREKVYLDANRKPVKEGDPDAQFVFNRDEAERLGYLKPEKKAVDKAEAEDKAVAAPKRARKSE